jgi:hypothetical protein
MSDLLSNLLSRKDKKDKPVCALCGKKIEDTAYMMIRGAIIIDEKIPKQPTIFTCPEQAFNYAQGYFAHSICWIKELKKRGATLYDMDKVYEAYNKKLKGDKDGLGKD